LQGRRLERVLQLGERLLDAGNQLVQMISFGVVADCALTIALLTSPAAMFANQNL